MPEDQKGPETPATEFRRSEDFVSVYANNVLFQPSVWDLKMFLGEVDFAGGKTIVEQHTAVSLPWMQAKVLAYWLRVNIEFYEINNGKIPVHPSVLPPRPQDIPAELQNDPRSKASWDALTRLYQEFMASL